jgi:hypothetical protein
MTSVSSYFIPVFDDTPIEPSSKCVVTGELLYRGFRIDETECFCKEMFESGEWRGFYVECGLSCEQIDSLKIEEFRDNGFEIFYNQIK